MCLQEARANALVDAAISKINAMEGKSGVGTGGLLQGGEAETSGKGEHAGKDTHPGAGISTADGEAEAKAVAALAQATIEYEGAKEEVRTLLEVRLRGMDTERY